MTSRKQNTGSPAAIRSARFIFVDGGLPRVPPIQLSQSSAAVANPNCVCMEYLSRQTNVPHILLILVCLPSGNPSKGRCAPPS